MMYDFIVLYPINPKALARFREAFRTSGAKDDPSDSELLLDLVMNHHARLRAWTPDTTDARKLQLLCEQRRKMVNHRVALTNRITSLLKQYFPQPSIGLVIWHPCRHAIFSPIGRRWRPFNVPVKTPCGIFTANITVAKRRSSKSALLKSPGLYRSPAIPPTSNHSVWP